MDVFDAQKAAYLAEQLSAELNKLGAEPREIQSRCSTLSVCKLNLPSLAQNLRLGIYAYLQDGKPKTYSEFATHFENKD